MHTCRGHFSSAAWSQTGARKRGRCLQFGTAADANGRITKEDVLNASSKSNLLLDGEVGGRMDKPFQLSRFRNRPEQRVAMTRIRQRIAERLLQSQQNAAILTT